MFRWVKDYIWRKKHTIYYEIGETGTCFTKCPHDHRAYYNGEYSKKPTMVASYACTRDCGSCYYQDKEHRYIICLKERK